MSQLDSTAKPRLPLWARILIGLFACGVLLSVTSIGLFSYMVATSGDPSHVKKIMETMVKFDSLPEGFRFDRAISLPHGDGVVLLIHEVDGTTFTIMKMPAVHGVDAKSLAKQLGEAGTQYGGKLNITENGKHVVAGKDFEYVLGSIDSGAGRSVEQMRGALLIDARRALTITGSTPKGPYNMEATKRLLNSIKGF